MEATEIVKNELEKDSYVSSVDILGAKVNVYTPFEFTPMSDFGIPGIIFSQEPTTTPYSLRFVSSLEDSAMHWEDENKTGYIFGDPSRFALNGRGISFAATQIALHALGERGMFLVHGAGISKAGRGIAILGYQGAGKTTLATRMSMGERNYALLGNDQVYLGWSQSTEEGQELFQIMPGTQYLKIRPLAIDQLPDNLARHSARQITVEVSNPWDSKIVVSSKMFEDLGGRLDSNGAVLTTCIVLRSNATSNSPSILEKVPENDLQTMLYLTELLGRQISGITTPVVDDLGELACLSPSMDNDLIRSNREKVYRHLNKRVGIYKITINDFSEAEEIIDQIFLNE